MGNKEQRHTLRPRDTLKSTLNENFISGESDIKRKSKRRAKRQKRMKEERVEEQPTENTANSSVDLVSRKEIIQEEVTTTESESSSRGGH